jgi:hypothetical protein
VNEYLSRRPSFREGVSIRLADDQLWTFPAPPKSSETGAASFGSEYESLVQAILEVEDRSELRLAELALAIFLLGYNYSLSPSAFERLLGFTSESSESAASQLAFHHVALQHVQSFLGASGASWDSGQAAPRTGWVSRLLAWLRNHSPSIWWSFDSRS